MDDLIEYISNITSQIDYKKLIFPTIMILLYIAGFVYLITIIKHNETKINKEETKIALKEEEKQNEIYVDIKGYVKTPGVYKLNTSSRVIDAIKIAGGLKDGANTRLINLSKKLEDGEVIVVYSDKEIDSLKKEKVIYIETPCVCEEVKNDACLTEQTTTNTSGKININTATKEQLLTLNGIGESKATSIIDYRNKNGKFKKIEDIKNVSGISETIYSKIKENITV